MEKEKPRKIKAEVVIPYKIALGKTWTKFLDMLKEEKIMGTTCKECGRVYVYPRTFCPNCFEDTSEWVEVGQEGIIDAWSYVNYSFYGMELEIPFVSAQITLDGSNTGICHVIRGIDLSDYHKASEKIKVGGRVRVVWNEKKNGNIFDIAYFKPI